MPSTAQPDLSAEQERDLAGDDLEELLAATNAKRLARGKRELSAGDVELRVFFEEQDARRRREG